jgi:hypothetical protein
MDRYVDRFAGEDPTRKAWQARVRSQDALYRLAWYTRQAVLAIGEQELRDAALESLADEASQALRSNETFDQNRSLLLTKTDFYDSSLLRLMQGCSTTNIETFISCIGDAYRNVSPQKSWASDPPEFEIWSGVREDRYSVDNRLQFVWYRNGVLDPFSFIVQVAFITPPAFAKSGHTYADLDPFEDADVNRAVEAAVSRGLSSSRTDLASFNIVRDFAQLQRLFRVALKGSLGSEFPIERLIALKRAAQSAMTPEMCKTPRWTPQPGLLEAKFYTTIVSVYNLTKAENSSETSGFVSKAKATMKACLSSVARQSPRSLDRIPEHQWEASCGFADLATEASEQCNSGDDLACAFRSVTKLARTTAQKRQLRFAAGIPTLEVSRPGMCVADPSILKNRAYRITAPN